MAWGPYSGDLLLSSSLQVPKEVCECYVAEGTSHGKTAQDGADPVHWLLARVTLSQPHWSHSLGQW